MVRHPCVDFVYAVWNLCSIVCMTCMAFVFGHTNICVNLLIICMHTLCLLCRPYGCHMRVFCDRRVTVLYLCWETYLHILHDCTEMGTNLKNHVLMHIQSCIVAKYLFLWETSLTHYHIGTVQLSVPVLYMKSHQQTVYHQPTSWHG